MTVSILSPWNSVEVNETIKVQKAQRKYWQAKFKRFYLVFKKNTMQKFHKWIICFYKIMPKIMSNVVCYLVNSPL